VYEEAFAHWGAVAQKTKKQTKSFSLKNGMGLFSNFFLFREYLTKKKRSTEQNSF